MKKTYLLFHITLLISSLLFCSVTFALNIHDESQNIILDGEMESPNMDSWNSWGKTGQNFTFEKIDDDIDGIQNESMHVSAQGTGGGFQQIDLPVEAGESYMFSMNYRLLSGELKPIFGIKDSNKDFDNRVDILKQATPQDTEEYWSYTRHITIPNNFAGDFRIVITLRNGEAYVDKMSLKKIGSYDYFSGSRSYDDNWLTRDPWMDLAGTTHWRSWGTPIELKKDWDPLPSDEWDKALYLDARATRAGAQQLNVPVIAGKYRLKFSYLLSSGTLQPLLGIKTSNSDFEKSKVLLSPADNWQQYERVFTLPQNFTGDFRMVFLLKDGEGFIDDVTLEPFVHEATSGTLYIQDRDRGDFVALPDSETFLLGQQDIDLGTFTFTASHVEDIILNKLSFVVHTDPNESISRFDIFELYNGNQLLGTTHDFHDNDLDGSLLRFEGLHLTIPRGEEVTLTLKADSIGLNLGGVPSSGFVILSPDLPEPSVEAIGMGSGSILGGTHLVFGPSYGGDDRDFDLYGKHFLLCATKIIPMLMLGGIANDIQPLENQILTEIGILNQINPSNEDAILKNLTITLSTQDFNLDPDDNRLLKVYIGPPNENQLIAEIPWVEGISRLDGGKQFLIPLSDLSLDSGDILDLFFTFDLSDFPVNSHNPILNFILSSVTWSDSTLVENTNDNTGINGNLAIGR